MENIWKVWSGADELDKSQGLTAYTRYHSQTVATAREYGFEEWVGSAVFAVISPTNDEAGCRLGMNRLMKGWRERKRVEDIPVSTYPINREKAWRMLGGEDPRQVIHGPKTWAFYQCILRPENRAHVVVDGHMYGLWVGERLRMAEAGLSLSKYREIEVGFIAMARLARLIPNQLQAVCWFNWRRVHGLARGREETGLQAVLGFGGEERE